MLLSRRSTHVLLVAALAPAVLSPIAAQPSAPRFEFQKLADGVYASIRNEAVGLGVDANNLFIIDDDGVVVVDTNFGQSSTRQVLATLRTLTDKPVKVVINTHPHDDHVLGNQVYREAFPGVEFIAHPFLKEYLPARGAINRKNQVQNLPDFATALKEALSKGVNLGGVLITAEERAGYAKVLALKPMIIVPGHGPVMRDTSYLRMVAALFTSVTSQVRAAAASGQPLEAVRKSVDLGTFRDAFAGDSQLKRFLFGNYLTGPAVASAYRDVKPASIK